MYGEKRPHSGRRLILLEAAKNGTSPVSSEQQANGRARGPVSRRHRLAITAEIPYRTYVDVGVSDFFFHRKRRKSVPR